MDNDKHRRPGERVFTLLLVLFAGFVFSEAYKVSGFSGLTTGGVMPMLAAGVMVVSSIFILADTLRKPAHYSGNNDKLEWLHFLFPLRVVLFALAIACYAILITSLGFLISSGLFLFVTIWALWRKGPLRSLVIAIASVAVIHVLFRIVFQVVLPNGRFLQ